MVMRFCIICLLAAVLSACASKPNTTFYWGSYQNVLYDMYNDESNYDPAQAIESLSRDIEQAKAEDRTIAPGIYAHLGYLYTTVNNNSAAKAAFEQEKQLYPESSVFMDRLLKRLQ